VYVCVVLYFNISVEFTRSLTTPVDIYTSTVVLLFLFVQRDRVSLFPGPSDSRRAILVAAHAFRIPENELVRLSIHARGSPRNERDGRRPRARWGGGESHFVRELRNRRRRLLIDATLHVYNAKRCRPRPITVSEYFRRFIRGPPGRRLPAPYSLPEGRLTKRTRHCRVRLCRWLFVSVEERLVKIKFAYNAYGLV